MTSGAVGAGGNAVKVPLAGCTSRQLKATKCSRGWGTGMPMVMLVLQCAFSLGSEPFQALAPDQLGSDVVRTTPHWLCLLRRVRM